MYVFYKEPGTNTNQLTPGAKINNEITSRVKNRQQTQGRGGGLKYTVLKTV